MNSLDKGYKEFKRNISKATAQIYSSLSSDQAPHTLMICCSDSRIIPTDIFNTNPGELFIQRSIGNFVPCYDDASRHEAITSALEYAVLMLKVKHIAVMGHSGCGGCRLIQSADNSLALSSSYVKDIYAYDTIESDSENHFLERYLEETNVRLQLGHLMTYPYVAEAVTEKRLELHGYYFDIGSIELFKLEGAVFKPVLTNS